MPDLFEIKSLACRRGQKLIFRDIGFSLRAGDLLLLTGTNGSGKSSLLRVLAGLLTPVKGEMLWQGMSVAKDPETHRERIHYIGHLDTLKLELTIAQMLGYWGALRGEKTSNVAACLEKLGLGLSTNTPVKYLSAGQKRRLTLTRLIMDEAPLWLLDEPTTALDTQGQEILFGLIEAHRKKGGIVILATHQHIDLPDTRSLSLDARVG
jgi:heme exporter protein A